MSVLCLACGGEAVARDRRVLHSATASNIVAASSKFTRTAVTSVRPFFSKLRAFSFMMATSGVTTTTIEEVWPPNSQRRWEGNHNRSSFRIYIRPAGKHTNTSLPEMKASTASLCFGNNLSSSILRLATSRALSISRVLVLSADAIVTHS